MTRILSFVLITIGFGTPIFFTLLGYVPFMTRILDKVKPYLVYPSTLGTYHTRPLPWLLGNAPTVGQALYIFIFFALNVILSAVNYHRSQPHPWGFGSREEILAYIGYRTGHIAYGLLPLVVLFSSRNNFLLWITNWNHGTYMLLHRWIARIFTVQAIIHSITLLECYTGTGSASTESKKAYWQWGIVATVLASAMLVFSVLYFRRLSYEIFLIGHIIMSIFVIVGCWYVPSRKPSYKQKAKSNLSTQVPHYPNVGLQFLPKLAHRRHRGLGLRSHSPCAPHP